MSKVTPWVIGLLFCVAACTSFDGDPPSKSTANTLLPAVIKPELPAPISGKGAPVVKLKDVEVHRISLSSPDWLAATAGALWVRLDSGQVLRLDPVTGAVRTRVDPPRGDGLCQAFGAAGNQALYACAHPGIIQRIDPSTGKVVAYLKSEFSSEQGQLVTADDKVWSLNTDGDKITPIDPADDSLGKSIDMGSYCVELASDGPIVYAACTSDGLVLRIDVVRRKVTHRLALKEARAIGASSAGVFVSFSDGVAQLDPNTIEPVAVYDVPLDLGGGINVDIDRAWLRADGGPFLTVIDPAAHQVLQKVLAPDLPSGGSALRIGDTLWATAYDDGTLVGLKTK